MDKKCIIKLPNDADLAKITKWAQKEGLTLTQLEQKNFIGTAITIIEVAGSIAGLITLFESIQEKYKKKIAVKGCLVSNSGKADEEVFIINLIRQLRELDEKNDKQDSDS